MEYYSQSEIQRLKAQVMAVALNHGIRARTYIERVAQLKAKQLKQDEIEILRRFCESQGLGYGDIKPIKPEGRRGR